MAGNEAGCLDDKGGWIIGEVQRCIKYKYYWKFNRWSWQPFVLNCTCTHESSPVAFLVAGLHSAETSIWTISSARGLNGALNLRKRKSNIDWSIEVWGGEEREEERKRERELSQIDYQLTQTALARLCKISALKEIERRKKNKKGAKHSNKLKFISHKPSSNIRKQTQHCLGKAYTIYTVGARKPRWQSAVNTRVQNAGQSPVIFFHIALTMKAKTDNLMLSVV